MIDGCHMPDDRKEPVSIGPPLHALSICVVGACKPAPRRKCVTCPNTELYLCMNVDDLDMSVVCEVFMLSYCCGFVYYFDYVILYVCWVCKLCISGIVLAGDRNVFVMAWSGYTVIAWIFRQVDFRRGWSPEVAKGHGGLGVLDNSYIY